MSAKRARAAFSADWAAAVESGDMERVQSVLNSGVGRVCGRHEGIKDAGFRKETDWRVKGGQGF